MIVEIDISATVLRSADGKVPPNLASYLDQNQWNAITNVVKTVHSQATLMTCLLEWACCFVFAFPCIFCGHPCFVDITAQETLRIKLRELNSTYFNGVEVLSTLRPGTFTVNTDRIARAPPGQPQPVLESVVYAQPEQTYTQPFVQQQPTSGYGKLETVVPVSAQPQSQFLVTIPPGAHQGSILSVVNPQGASMQVTVPPGAQPGSQILVKY